MRLPSDFGKLVRLKLSEMQLQSAICERRRAIRKHREQKGDDRCWVDDFTVWLFLDDSPMHFSVPSSFGEKMVRCGEFYAFRRADKADPVPVGAITNRRFWNRDLFSMTPDELLKTLYVIQQAIRKHRDIFDRPRTLKDDRQLYSVLPENLPADFRLPKESEFLGEAKAPHAGCPSFWRSHEKCSASCNFHKWGPCTGLVQATRKLHTKI